MTITESAVRSTYEPIVLDGIDVLSLPRRPYDFNKGDRRFFDRDEAIEHAEHEAILTGVRQAIRLDGPAIEGHDPLYLVQAVGS